MFSTINSVKEYTGYDVSLDLIKRAQSIVEIFIGKDEVDVENPSDFLILDKMTSYQAAYMLENEDLIYKQIGTASVNIGGSVQSFDTAKNSPYVAPLTFLAAQGLSFKKSRSFKTGRIFQYKKDTNWRAN